MDQELERIIGLFNAAQERAIGVLERDFECSRPESSNDFIFRCVPAIRKANYIAAGYKIRPHGIGMEIDIDGTIIDFDFGANGEFTGFDSWRLYEFIQRNKIESRIGSEEQMDEIVNIAISKGYIVKANGMGSVHYVNS